MDNLTLPQQKETIEDEIVGKNFGVRAIAFMIDLFVINFVSGVIISVTWYEFFSQQIVMTLSSILLFVAYFAVFEWLYGATLGKVILGMRVIKQDGAACSLGAAVVRALFRYIDGILFGVVAYVKMEETPLRQRFGDRSAKTVVVGAKESIIESSKGWWWFFIALGIYSAIYLIIIWLISSIPVQ